MVLNIQLSSGSILGKDHLRKKTNYQDALFTHTDVRYNFILCLITDGCTRGLHNEIGAQIGSRIAGMTIIDMVRKTLNTSPTAYKSPFFWRRVRTDIITKLHSLALLMGESLSEVILNYLLFTLVGVLILENETVFFSIGDGVFIINGEVMPLGPFPNNEPPYIGYCMLDPVQIPTVSQELLEFQINKVMPTAELHTFLVGCDGTMDLIKAKDKKIPGQDAIVGDIRQFWTDDLYFVNPYAITRRLWVVNAYGQNYEGKTITIDYDRKMVIRENGHLPDDTSFIVGRREITPQE